MGRLKILASGCCVAVMLMLPVARPAAAFSSVSTDPSVVENFLTVLANAGMNPNSASLITRSPLSVVGTIITLHSDNVEVFSYPTVSAATTDAAVLTALYSKTNRGNAWGGFVHVYQKNTLVVFYLGSNQDILSALKANLGQPL